MAPELGRERCIRGLNVTHRVAQLTRVREYTKEALLPTIAIPISGGRQFHATLDITPDTCPICHRGIEPIDTGRSHLLSDEVEIERVFICPLRSCNHLFLGRYNRNAPGSAHYSLRRVLPAEPKNCSHPEELTRISPDFCAIYNQAHKAEQLGLTLVSGPGYRKALEFLVKDYLTLQSSDEAKKEIAEMPLMACIKKYVTDTRMRTTAERATWLGNDETHYIRRWENQDLQDMKNLIQLTCYWIQSEHSHEGRGCGNA